MYGNFGRGIYYISEINMENIKYCVGTKTAAKIIGVTISSLHQAVWHGRIPEPQKFAGGFVWQFEDLARAYKTMHGISVNRIKLLKILKNKSQISPRGE